jgi:hypothetical protein
MSDPPWKPLLDELARFGRKSPIAERLERSVAMSLVHRSVAAEIMSEMAASLRRADEKINTSLLSLEVLGLRIDALASDSPQRAKELAAFDAEREKAKLAIWELRVQREAMGFRRNHELETLYPLPPKRR